MRRLLVLVTVSMVGITGIAAALAQPGAAADRDCRDFANQAAAQKYFVAHGGPAKDPDRLDADGDGVACESLPCPCAKGSGGGGGPSSPTTGGEVDPGRSVDLGNVSETTGCRVDGPLPDRSCTPGARFSKADRRMICAKGYAGKVRDVPESLKTRVYAAYGITRHRRGEYEVDHLVSLELGGSNAQSNLFPEAASPKPGYHEKDRLENRLHDEVCAGDRGLRATQRAIARDWLRVYEAEF